MSAAVRILVTDREPAAAGLARLVIEARLPDSEIIETHDAATLEESLREGRFAAAVVALHTGWADGFEVARWIKGRYPDRPVVMLAGAGEEVKLPEGVWLGVDAWIRKTSQGFLRLPELLAELLGRVTKVGPSATRSPDGEVSELEQLAHVLSHDLQAPLDLVSRDAERLEAQFPEGQESEAARRVQRLRKSAARMQSMLDAITDLARIGTDGRPLEVVPLTETVQEALANLAPAVEKTGAEVHCERLPSVRADRAQMVQLFQNLLGNALKFQGASPPNVVVSAFGAPEGWTVTVTDNGIGIAAECQATIFDMFKRLHNAEDFPGSGVGLAVARRIMQRHGGQIGVSSEPGRGSTFRLTFPHGSVVHTSEEAS